MIHSAPYASFSLSLTDSTRLKGVALLLLLWHHLFYMGGTQYTEWHVAGIPVIQQTGLAAKVCVALLVLLSGYGLAVQAAHKPMGYGMFLRKRLKKLFINYWVMWLLFVPIGFLFFGWTLQDIYGNHAVAKLLVTKDRRKVRLFTYDRRSAALFEKRFLAHYRFMKVEKAGEETFCSIEWKDVALLFENSVINKLIIK